MEDDKKWELCQYDVLEAEHDVMHDAFNEWIGSNRDTATDDVQYLCGVHDLAHKLMSKFKE